VTGNSGAKGDMVALPGATIYDAVHENGYLCFAVLEKGDFSQMRAEQDVIMYDETNSINNPNIKIQINDHSQDMDLVQDVSDVMDMHDEEAYDYVIQYPEGSGERYDAYNRWAIDTAADIIEYMSDNVPDQRYILTINAGAVDCAGHYRRNSGYIESIEGIDAAVMPLYELCIENNLAFIFTGDHGMAFAADDVRGGHQSEKYAVTLEAQKIPLIIHAPDVDKGVVTGEYGQEDIAPTVLNILNLPIELNHADGSAIPIKDHVNLKIDVPPESTVELLKEDRTIASASHDSQYVFLGIEPGNTYIVRISSNEMLEELNGVGKTVMEKGVLEYEVFMATDVALTFAEQISSSPENGGLLQNQRHVIGCALIALINITGLLVILRILKK
jgi:bisphosphoglycerate-independent phosphoglycerate mutase (AlkP superfamily)